MKKLNLYKKWLLIFIVCLIMASVFYSVHNIASISSIHNKFINVETRDKDYDYIMAGAQRVILRGFLLESVEGQLFSDIELDILLINIKNAMTLFSRLSIALILSFYFSKWIVSDPNIRVPSFIMLFLQLKDGKKDAASLPI